MRRSLVSVHALRSAAVLACVSSALGCALPPDGTAGPSTEEIATSTTVSFQDGVGPNASYAGTRDGYLADATPSSNFGTATELIVDDDYPDGTGHHAVLLLRWDLSSIPTGSTVSAASLGLSVTNPTSGTYTLYALSRDWSETAATWTNATGTQAWGAPGARGASDRGATALGTVAASATGEYTLALNAAGVAVVQGWVDQPATNFGFVVDRVGETDGLRVTSREGAPAAARPRLSVTYAAPSAGGTGLHGDYFANATLSGTAALGRTDATVGFDWGTGAPASALPVDHFSARWTGTVVPRYSETYTFTTTSDDGVRLWIDGVELVNNWTDHAAASNSGTIALSAGTHYTVRMEYYENAGDAVARLAWSSAHQAAETVPQSQLFPPSTTGVDGGVDAGHDAGRDAATPTDVPVACTPTAPATDSLAAQRAACAFGAGAEVASTIADAANVAAARSAIQHLIILVHENRSMDHFFGYTGHGIEQVPASFTNLNGSTVEHPYRYPTGCACDITHDQAHIQNEWDHGAMDGFIRTDGMGSFGYYDDADHPFYTWLVTTFATSDRYFCGGLGDTGHNRHFIWHARGNYTGASIFPALDAAGVNWVNFYDRTEPLYNDLSTHASTEAAHLRHDPSLSLFYAALRDGTGATLPQLSIIDQSDDEHPAGDMHRGENATRTLVQNVLASPLWPHIALIYTYDEGGGFFDHVAPPALCIAAAGDATEATYDHLGIRVPIAVVSPYAVPGHVSHVTHSHTSITRLIELLYNLPALTNRDANSDALLDLFDFHCPGHSTPPTSVPAAGAIGCPATCSSGP